MPYTSDKQREYFNANRKKLESQGVDVNEWNKAGVEKVDEHRVKMVKYLDELIVDEKKAPGDYDRFIEMLRDCTDLNNSDRNAFIRSIQKIQEDEKTHFRFLVSVREYLD